MWYAFGLFKAPKQYPTVSRRYNFLQPKYQPNLMSCNPPCEQTPATYSGLTKCKLWLNFDMRIIAKCKYDNILKHVSNS